MASAFGHALAAIAPGKYYPYKKQLKFWMLAAFCAVFPDADVIAFNLGIPYEHVFGHRGITHSIFFALLFGPIITLLFYRKTSLFSAKGITLSFFFALFTLSHALLDAMTTGGLGVAFFAPFDNARHFLPWRPIKVSPIGAGNFFAERGWNVIKSEAIWIGLPSTVLIVGAQLIKKWRKAKA